MRIATKEEVQIGLGGFIDKCVVTDRRDRFSGFLSSSKGIKKWLVQLDHFQNYLDIHVAKPIHSTINSQELITKFGLNSEAEVLIFSTLNGMQCVVYSLAASIQETYKMGNGSVLCSLTSKVPFWFYFGEEPHAQYYFSAK